MPTSRLLACALLLLTTACPSGDDGDDEVGDDESDGEESGGEDETETGPEECTIPPDETMFGPQQYVELVNQSGATVFVRGGTCGASPLTVEVDGVEYRDNVGLFQRCSVVIAESFCVGMCGPEDGIISSLRIDAGATLLYPFDAKIWAAAPVAESCQVELACPPPETCEVQQAVVDGASVTLTIEAFSQCTGDACNCGSGTSCELGTLSVYEAIGGASTMASVTFTYPDSGYPQLVIQ